MKRFIVLTLLAGFMTGICGCAGSMDKAMDMVASMQKGRYIVDGKLIDPPYSDPVQNLANGKIWMNGVYFTKPAKSPASAKLDIDEYKREMDVGNLMIIGGEKSEVYRVIKGDAVKKFNDLKAIIASKKPKSQKIKEIDAILEGAVDAKLVLDRNSGK
jgi:hypothetical protein